MCTIKFLNTTTAKEHISTMWRGDSLVSLTQMLFVFAVLLLAVLTQISRTAEIARVCDHYVVRGHSTSLVLVHCCRLLVKFSLSRGLYLALTLRWDLG